MLPTPESNPVSAVWSGQPLTCCRLCFLYTFPSGFQYSSASLPIIFSFLARPEGPLPSATWDSQDEETQFLYHHLLHSLQLPRCFHHGIFVHPLPSFACWKWPHWVNGRILSFIFFSPWSHFIAKISSPLPVFFPCVPSKLNNSLHLQNSLFFPFPI